MVRPVGSQRHPHNLGKSRLRLRCALSHGCDQQVALWDVIDACLHGARTRHHTVPSGNTPPLIRLRKVVWGLAARRRRSTLIQRLSDNRTLRAGRGILDHPS